MYYMHLLIPLSLFPFAIPTLSPELYEKMNLDEPDAKLIPRVLTVG